MPWRGSIAHASGAQMWYVSVPTSHVYVMDPSWGTSNPPAPIRAGVDAGARVPAGLLPAGAVPAWRRYHWRPHCGAARGRWRASLARAIVPGLVSPPGFPARGGPALTAQDPDAGHVLQRPRDDHWAGRRRRLPGRESCRGGVAPFRESRAHRRPAPCIYASGRRSAAGRRCHARRTPLDAGANPRCQPAQWGLCRYVPLDHQAITPGVRR